MAAREVLMNTFLENRAWRLSAGEGADRFGKVVTTMQF